MSASAAKVGRKENSNHDGADETSGNAVEWRLSRATPFSFVSRHFLIYDVGCLAIARLNRMQAASP